MLFNAFLVHHKKEYFRLLSHGFIHGDFFHLFVNVYVLYGFGGVVEQNFRVQFGQSGSLMFVFLYLSGILVSCLPALTKHKNNLHYNALGASGAVSAVLFSSIIMHPTASLMLVILPIPIPAFIFGILYLIYEASMNKNYKYCP